jgi:putative transcriptional regulator
MDGKKIKRQRVLNDLTQTELAKLLGIDRGYLSSIENNKANPSLTLLTRIAETLKCSIKDFF